MSRMPEAEQLSDRTDAGERFLEEVESFNQRALALGLGDVRNYYWYHTVALPEHGLITPGLYDFRRALGCFPFPADMTGMRVLDVGSATGFFAFEFEKRGARVVSVELPSLEALDRFPGQKLEQTLEKIEQMMTAPLDGANGFIRRYNAEQLYFYLLEGPFDFCRKLLKSKIERCYSTIYDLSAERLGSDGFDLIFLGDVLLHTLNPLMALAAIAPLCRGTLVLSQVMPEDRASEPVMHYVGGDHLAADEVSWWWPNEACLVQLLKKLGFREVLHVGHHTGALRPSGYVYDRAILKAVK